MGKVREGERGVQSKDYLLEVLEIDADLELPVN